MIFLGIDPGTATTGFGLIEKKVGDTKLTTLTYGVISTSKTLSDAERLLILANDLEALIKKHKPDYAGVEKLFFATNAKTIIPVAQARGIVIMTLTKHGIPFAELTPLQVKSSMTGYGKAEKGQIQYMVQKTLGLKAIPKPDDAADALAIAICISNSHHFPKLDKSKGKMLK